jgi:Family of unknown function (DUF5320)
LCFIYNVKKKTEIIKEEKNIVFFLYNEHMFIIFVVLIESKTNKKEVIMPRGNKTGTNGMGPMTGRRMGSCVGNSNVEFERNQGYGNGNGRGFGRSVSSQGDQYQQNFSDKGALENELRILKEQMSFLEKQLSNIDKNEKQ